MNCLIGGCLTIIGVLMEIICRDQERLNWRKYLKNGHLIFFGVLYVLLVIGSISDPLHETVLGNVYTFLAWLPTIVFYWTPSFQKAVFSKTDKALVFLIYPITFIPFVGTFVLSIPVMLKLKARFNEKWERANKRNNLKSQISDFQVPQELQEEKREIETKTNNIYTDEALQQTINEFARLKQKRKNILSLHIDKFINQYGKGNPDQIRNLQELIKREENLDLDYDTIKDLVFSKFENKQREEFNKKMNHKDTENYDETIEAFVEEFGGGDTKTFKFLRDYTGKSEVRMDVEEKLNNLQREKELDKFKQELESGKDHINLLESLKQDKINWQEIEGMEGLDFESLVADLFNEKGYDSKVTVGSGDQGADVVAKKDFETIVIQAKRYKGKVSNSAVQEVVASKRHYDANRGIVITNSKFTSSARELAESNDIELWSGEMLRQEVDKYLNKNY